MGRGVPKSGRRMTKKYRAQLAGVPYGNTAKTVEPVAPVQNRFTIDERFSMLADMCKMVARQEQPAMLIVGPGGVGKSFSVIAALTQSGLKDLTFVEDFAIGASFSPKKSFKVAKGYCTPRGLYKTLYDNRESVLVLDDMDRVLKDDTSISLLKAALDSCDKRQITWRSDRMDDEYPNQFLFKGSVVFISNMSKMQMDQAVLTRTLCVDLSMTNQDKVNRIRTIANESDFMPEMARVEKQDAVNLIERLQDKVLDLNLRSLIQCVRIRHSQPAGKWEKIADYALCG